MYDQASRARVRQGISKLYMGPYSDEQLAMLQQFGMRKDPRSNCYKAWERPQMNPSEKNYIAIEMIKG